MAIHESLSLYAYNPLFGKRRIGYYYGGGSWNSSYFHRNPSHFQIVKDIVFENVKERFAESRNLSLVYTSFHFDNDWNCYIFWLSFDCCGNYPLNLEVLVYCPALTPRPVGADNDINNTIKD